MSTGQQDASGKAIDDLQIEAAERIMQEDHYVLRALSGASPLDPAEQLIVAREVMQRRKRALGVLGE
jgi:hypothetical protein